MVMRKSIPNGHLLLEKLFVTLLEFSIIVCCDVVKIIYDINLKFIDSCHSVNVIKKAYKINFKSRILIVVIVIVFLKELTTLT